MDAGSINEELITILENNHVEIRKAPLGGEGSGLCKIRGKDVFFFDTQEEYADIAAKCASAVAAIIDIEAIYLKPELREFVVNNSRPEA